ncbi:MAG: ScpA family protein [Patescibacteria group bacterium]
MNTVTIDPTLFAIKTEQFEGPLELLIELVEKRKLLINDISLAAVTDEYIKTVSLMQELSLPNTAQFITLAATLLLIKSKSLLPVLDLSEEEETSIDELERRLQLYQLYREVALDLKSQFGRSLQYEPEYVPPRNPIFLPDRFCAESELLAAMERVLINLPRTEKLATAKVRPAITLEEMMEKLQRRIEQQIKTRFSEIRAKEPGRKNVIVGFLAILELFKQGTVLITQIKRFDDIEIELERSHTPKYY